MITTDALRDQPTLTGSRVRLEPLTSVILEDYALALADPEVIRLTGSRGDVDRAQVANWLSTRPDQHDRADWAIVNVDDAAFLGEAVLNELDTHNASMNYRVLLAGPQHFGRGYGTEVTRLVVDFALNTLALHRVSLGVFTFNPRARHVYEKCGFIQEGRLRESLYWDGQWYDEILMSVLQGEV